MLTNEPGAFNTNPNAESFKSIIDPLSTTLTVLLPPVNTATPSFPDIPLFTVTLAPLSIITFPGVPDSPTANIPTPF